MDGYQRDALRRRIIAWRAIAEPVGPLHALWDVISDADALLAGRETILPGTPDEVYAELMAIGKGGER